MANGLLIVIIYFCCYFETLKYRYTTDLAAPFVQGLAGSIILPDQSNRSVTSDHSPIYFNIATFSLIDMDIFNE